MSRSPNPPASAPACTPKPEPTTISGRAPGTRGPTGQADAVVSPSRKSDRAVMWVYALRRVLLIVPVIVLVSMISFGLLMLLPGDPAMAILGPEQVRNAELYNELRRELGLDQPLPVQYLTWVGKVASGDFGRSSRSQQPVAALIGQSIGPTMQLSLLGMAIALLIALPVGVISAVRPG